MGLTIRQVLAFVLPMVAAPPIARRRADLSSRKTYTRFGLAAGGPSLHVSALSVGAAAGEVDDRLSAFVLAVLAVQMSGAATGLSLNRAK